MSTITACRACGGTALHCVLSLGETPLANALVDAADRGRPEARYPLELVRCGTCTLLQITETVPPDILFRDYRYFSSFSETMLRHAEALTSRLIAERALGASSLAAEIASNDGYLLRGYVAKGVPVLGIEPARNIAKVAEERGVRTVAEFFGADLAESLAAKGLRADVLHANNVMAHVPDIRGVLRGVRTFLADDGLFVLETPYIEPMLAHREFDTIYHEHLFYWSLTALVRVLSLERLVPVDVERLAIHGGSIRVHIQREELREHQKASVTSLLAAESGWGVGSAAPYDAFAARVAALKTELVGTLREFKAAGRSIAAYGAAAKGSTLLNHFGIGADVIDFVVDRSPEKQGRFMPGVDVPILPPEELLARRPDYCLLLTWNFAEEIMQQQRAYRDAGGRFIVPIPDVVIR